jgi:hypothetical protein
MVRLGKKEEKVRREQSEHRANEQSRKRELFHWPQKTSAVPRAIVLIYRKCSALRWKYRWFSSSLVLAHCGDADAALARFASMSACAVNGRHRECLVLFAQYVLRRSNLCAALPLCRDRKVVEVSV